MLRELKNEAKITLLLHTKSPLTIRSKQTKRLNPTMLDMSCVKSRYQGKDTVIIPGSSLKGVIRSRYEKIAGILGGKCCILFQDDKKCNNTPKNWDKMLYREKREYVCKNLCPACQLFGSKIMASKIFIADAYPIGDYVLGERTGVGINRITGAAQHKALYDFETVEEGTFQVGITLKNYELYQMALLMYVLKDLDDGYVTLGAASTRGNGLMGVEKMEICLREYRKGIQGWRGAIDGQEIPLGQKYNISYNWNGLFFGELRLPVLSLDEMIDNCKCIDIQGKMGRV